MLNRPGGGATHFPALVTLKGRNQRLQHARIAAEIGMNSTAEFFDRPDAFAAIAAGKIIHQPLGMLALPLGAEVQPVFTRAAAIRAVRRPRGHAMGAAAEAQ